MVILSRMHNRVREEILSGINEWEGCKAEKEDLISKKPPKPHQIQPLRFATTAFSGPGLMLHGITAQGHRVRLFQ